MPIPGAQIDPQAVLLSLQSQQGDDPESPRTSFAVDEELENTKALRRRKEDARRRSTMVPLKGNEESLIFKAAETQRRTSKHLLRANPTTPTNDQILAPMPPITQNEITRSLTHLNSAKSRKSLLIIPGDQFTNQSPVTGLQKTTQSKSSINSLAAGSPSLYNSPRIMHDSIDIDYENEVPIQSNMFSSIVLLQDWAEHVQTSIITSTLSEDNLLGTGKLLNRAATSTNNFLLSISQGKEANLSIASCTNQSAYAQRPATNLAGSRSNFVSVSTMGNNDSLCDSLSQLSSIETSAHPSSIRKQGSYLETSTSAAEEMSDEASIERKEQVSDLKYMGNSSNEIIEFKSARPENTLKAQPKPPKTARLPSTVWDVVLAAATDLKGFTSSITSAEPEQGYTLKASQPIAGYVEKEEVITSKPPGAKETPISILYSQVVVGGSPTSLRSPLTPIEVQNESQKIRKDSKEERTSNVSTCTNATTDGSHSENSASLALANVENVTIGGPWDTNIIPNEKSGPVRMYNDDYNPPVADQDRNQSMGDYDTFFKGVITSSPVHVFRIEYMYPIIIPKESYGVFCTADCYIILSSDKIENTVKHVIHTWIPEAASIDKKFCCAMYAVGLRNWLDSKGSIKRQNETEEDPEFIALFQNFRLLDLTHACPSALFEIADRKYPTRLYRVYGKTMQVSLVETSSLSLDSKSVFLLDTGMVILQWNGKNSTLQHRSKCRIISHRISMGDRSGRAEVDEMDEGAETPVIWEILGGSNRAEVIANPLSESVNILYKVHATETSDISSLVTASGILSKRMLDHDSCYILDAGVEIYLWVGRESPNNLVEKANNLLGNILASLDRPAWLALHKHTDEMESEVFKLRFKDWETDSAHTQDWQNLFIKKSMPISGQGPQDEIDIKEPELEILDLEYLTSQIEAVNRSLVTFTNFIHSRGRFLQLNVKEQGHFFINDAYLFLCVYDASKDTMPEQDKHMGRSFQTLSDKIIDPISPALAVVDLEEMVSEDEAAIKMSGIFSSQINEHPDEIQGTRNEPLLKCVIYFWKGSKCSRIAYSTFKFKTLPEMELLVNRMYNCPIEIITLPQHKEPFALLAHFQNTAIYHLGQRSILLNSPKLQYGTIRVYQFRHDLRYYTLRACQVDATSFNLVTTDYFYVHTITTGYIWVGSKADKASISKVHEMVSKIQLLIEEFVPIEIHNQGEECQFLLQYTNDIIDIQVIKVAKFTYVDDKFTLKALPFYTAQDLDIDATLVIWAQDSISLWIGEQASQVVISKLKQRIGPGVTLINQGEESKQFKSHFHGWSIDSTS